MMICATAGLQTQITGSVSNGLNSREATTPLVRPSLAYTTSAHTRPSLSSRYGLSSQEGILHKHHVKRRPSFPQGGIEWRMRGRFSQDINRQRRKTVSVCKLTESEEDIPSEGEGEEEEGVLHETSCPLFHSYVEKTSRVTTTNVDRTFCNAVRGKVEDTAFVEKVIECHDVTGSFPLDKCSYPGDTTLGPWTLETEDCKCKSENYRNNNNNNNSRDHKTLASTGIRRGGGGHAKKGRKRNRRETVVLNVGGHVFETYRATVRRLRTPIFSCDDQLEFYYRKSHGDYFFDRDPTAFGSILNYLRTGELHIPTNMCGPALQNELEYWGIDETDISRCCWTQYNTWKTQCRSLEKLEYDRKFSTTQQVPPLDSDNSCWARCRSKIWTFLQDPGSSKKAKVYAWISIIFVFFSIFSFCAETHPYFKVKAKDVSHLSTFYQFLHIQSIPWSIVNIPLNSTNINGTKPSYPDVGVTNSSGSTSDGVHAEVNQVVSWKRKKRRLKRKANPHCILESSKEYLHSKDDDWSNKLLPHPALLIIDVSCLFFFTVEYITRFWCSPSKLNFLRASQNIVDFLAFAPDYIEIFFLLIGPMQNEGMAIMEMLFILRILRLFRIFRLIRHVPGLWILLYTLKASFNELMLMCVFLLIGMVVFATLMHFVEPDGIFTNIPVGFWWSVVTMTTVGYGDMYPQSASGYFIGSCCAVAGLLMIAFTVPIIVSNFVLYYTHVQYGLARKEKDPLKDNEDSDFNGSKNTLDVEKANSTSIVLPSMSTVTAGPQVTTTTKNGKSYTFLSNVHDLSDATEGEVLEKCENDGDFKTSGSRHAVFFLESQPVLDM